MERTNGKAPISYNGDADAANASSPTNPLADYRSTRSSGGSWAEEIITDWKRHLVGDDNVSRATSSISGDLHYRGFFGGRVNATKIRKSKHIGINMGSFSSNQRSPEAAAAPAAVPARPCSIYRVPRNTWQRDYCQPAVVTIGPYHYQKEDVSITRDDKWWCVRHLTALSPAAERQAVLRRCFERMKMVAEDARSCYAEDAGIQNEIFAELLLLDGCFILDILLKIVGNIETHTQVTLQEELDECRGESSDSKISNDNSKEVKWEIEDGDSPLIRVLWKWNLLKVDLLMLENQIPFFVLEELFDVVKTPAMNNISLIDLALALFEDMHPRRTKDVSRISYNNSILHLLHLYHSSLVPSNYRYLGSRRGNSEPIWIPSALELQESGIKFKMKEEMSGFLDITFCDGILEIPPLHMYEYSDVLFRNLVSFERCYPGAASIVSSYVTFMSCIMHSERDVRFLHMNGIVVNRLSNGGEVAALFSQLCYRVQTAYSPNYLQVIYEDVMRHHSDPWRRWKAELKHKYLNNPWVAASLLAGILVIILNFIQTFYTVLSYYK